MTYTTLYRKLKIEQPENPLKRGELIYSGKASSSCHIKTELYKSESSTDKYQ